MWVKPLLVSRKNLTLLNTHTHIDNCHHHFSAYQHKERGYHNYNVFINSPNTSRVMRYITLERSKHVNIWLNLWSERIFCTNTFKALTLVGIVTFWITSIFNSSTWIPSRHILHTTLFFINTYFIYNFISESRRESENWSCLVESFKGLKSIVFFFGTKTIGDTHLKVSNLGLKLSCNNVELLYKIALLYNTQLPKLCGNWYTLLQLDVVFDAIFSFYLSIDIYE